MAVKLVHVALGHAVSSWKNTLAEIRERRVVERMWEGDHTVWKTSPEEIVNRLGWLRSGGVFKDHFPQVEAFVSRVLADGYRQVLLLGMGGSSLAPEIFRKILGSRAGYLDLSVCDTTAPATIAALGAWTETKKTLFVVSTKSGGTVETLSAMKFFYRRTASRQGEKHAGLHYVAITDPGSSLVGIAMAQRFRRIFYGDPDIGGRFSALSVFGLVPAALVGADISSLLEWTDERLSPVVKLGVEVGAMLGVMAESGCNKATFVLSPALLPFGDWLEQLIAESTGKEGKGILPVVGEPLGAPGDYGRDRFFIGLSLRGEAPATGLAILNNAGQPVVEMVIDHLQDLGELMYVWEVATAVAGYVLQVNPFDQPDVETAKRFTRAVIAQLQSPSVEKPVLVDGDISIYGKIPYASDAGDALITFLRSAAEGHYIALQTYLPQEPHLTEMLDELRLLLRNRYLVATTVGYGPRFLHSTGQLHKGDDGRGLFIQFTGDNPVDLPIPDSMTGPGASLTFGILQLAQAEGDARALESRDRRVIRFHFSRDSRKGIRTLISRLQKEPI
ncbi:MAG: glucose-6-phosphate isomerase [Deltaproteobacteria bacterium]|nr:glucose-6-phosphate isomerase [Deltaproteobacteria bacterium]